MAAGQLFLHKLGPVQFPSLKPLLSAELPGSVPKEDGKQQDQGPLVWRPGNWQVALSHSGN